MRGGIDTRAFAFPRTGNIENGYLLFAYPVGDVCKGLGTEFTRSKVCDE